MADQQPPPNVRLLVSDDEPDFCRVLQGWLEPEGYEVRITPDALETVAMAQAWQPALILTDLCKRDTPSQVGGLEMIAQLRAGATTTSIRVLVASAGCASEEGRERALQAGATATIAKPLDLTELLHLIRDVLAR